MTAISDLTERNRAFAATGEHRGATAQPRLGLFIITCLDARLDPARFLGLRLGEAMIIRNAGGRVTPEVTDHLGFIALLAEGRQPAGCLMEVAVIHHSDCGTRMLTRDAVRQTVANRTGTPEVVFADLIVEDPEATVKIDVARLRSASEIPGRVSITGHVYDVETGLMRTVET